MGKDYTHYILTRYNCGLYSSNYYGVECPDLWMEQRAKLFEKCRKSVLDQKSQNFTWLISVDPNTPPCYLDDIFVDNRMWKVTFHPKKVFDYVEPRSDWVMTTRLDNDDYYMAGAVEIMQRTVESYIDLHLGCEDSFIVDIDYYRHINGKNYSSGRRGPNSPFLSLIEKTGKNLLGCYYTSHTYMPKFFRSIKIMNPLACMVFHGNNQSEQRNELYGAIMKDKSTPTQSQLQLVGHETNA